MALALSASTSRIYAAARRSKASSSTAAFSTSSRSSVNASTLLRCGISSNTITIPSAHFRQAEDLLKSSGYLVIEVPRLDSLTFRLYGNRWPGLQAPQHTVLYDREMLLRMVRKAGLEVVDYLPYGAFPAFFYFFAGAAFKLLKGKGLNLSKAIYPYFVGQMLFAPILAFEKHLNFAMQTVVCRRED